MGKESSHGWATGLSLPNSLQVISRSPCFDNAYFVLSHGYLGLIMAVVTGAAY